MGPTGRGDGIEGGAHWGEGVMVLRVYIWGPLGGGCDGIEGGAHWGEGVMVLRVGPTGGRV